MSLFGDDGINSIIGDDLNENLNTDDLPGGSDVEEKQSEDEEDGKVAVKVEAKKRSTRNVHRFGLQHLKGPRGIQTIENYFKDIKFHGKGHEKKDLNEIMKRMHHWAHRMYPNYKFDDILINIERLSKKKELKVYMERYRQGQLMPEIIPEQNNDEVNQDVEEPFDEFDALLGQQIAISKIGTPRTPNSVRSEYSINSSAFHTPKVNENIISSTPHYGIDSPHHNMEEETIIQPQPKKLTNEQLAKIAENRRLAQLRLQAKKNESLIPPS